VGKGLQMKPASLVKNLMITLLRMKGWLLETNRSVAFSVEFASLRASEGRLK
jgi:hypothetical protein